MSSGDGVSPDRPDRRDEERLAILGELQGEVMAFQPMAITEIGRSGVQIETAFPFQLDSLHDLRLPLGELPVIVKGRVVHCSIIDVDQEHVQYRTGLEFVELPDRMASAIGRFVKAIRDGRRGG